MWCGAIEPRPSWRGNARVWEEIIVCRDYTVRAHRPHGPPSTTRRRRIASANQLDDAGNRIYRPATAYAMRAPSPSSRRPPASDAVSRYGVRRVARDGSLQQPCVAVRWDARVSAKGADVAGLELRWSKKSRSGSV
jgi:hypothetical protein